MLFRLSLSRNNYYIIIEITKSVFMGNR